MHTAYSVTAASRLSGVPREAAEKWIAVGLIPVTTEKRVRTVGLRGLLALDLVRRLRARKVSVPTISLLTNYLHSVTDEQIAAAIEAGRSILVSTSDSARAELTSAADSIRNTAGRDVMLVAIDLAVCLDGIRAAIADLSTSARVVASN